MSWFSFTDIAKNALSEAQKKIDQALDIQHKGDALKTEPSEKVVPEVVNDAAKTASTRQVTRQPGRNKRSDFTTKKKSKLGGSSLGARRIAQKTENDDLFSVLNDAQDIKSNSSESITKSEEFLYTEVPLSAPSEQVVKDSTEKEGITDTTCPLDPVEKKKSLITESASEATLFTNKKEDHESGSQENSLPNSVNEPKSLENSYSEAFLTVSSENEFLELVENQEIPTNISHDSDHCGRVTNIDIQSEQDIRDTYSRETESVLQLTTVSESIAFEEVSGVELTRNDPKSQASPPNELDGLNVFRGVSPSSSTPASSEIDILDHESTTSELSTRNAEGHILLQNPLHIAHITTIDSDASQALSPLSEDNRSTSSSSPLHDHTSENLSDSVKTIIPAHSFVPVNNVESQKLSEAEPDQLENGVLFVETPQTEEQNVVGHQIGNETSVAHEKLSGDCETHTNKEEEREKYMIMSEKMEVYEQQLFNLSCKNAQLNEENDNLRSEVLRTRELCEKQAEKDMEDISDAMKNLHSANRLLKEEKANLTKQMAVLRSQLASRMTNEQVQNAITEKEESIKGLMEEGEALSKKHLQQNNLIKKLKSQSQERETELKGFKEKAAAFEEENVKLKEQLQLAHGQGQEEREASLRISDAYEQRERQTQMLKEGLSLAEEKQRSLQVNLDNAYKQIGDLNKQKAEQESKSIQEWNMREEELKRVNGLEMKKILSEQEHQRDLLMLQILELNNSVSRTEAMAARKDDDHRREIRDIQQRLQESEVRNQDLSDSVSIATRPLLRQIENLQSTHSSQQRSWNALEKTLNNRLGEAQADLLAARENERLAQSGAIEAKSRATAYEKQIESDQKTLAKQAEEIETLNKRMRILDDECSTLRAELTVLQETHKNLISKSRRERLTIENQLQMEKVRSEAERKKYIAQQEMLQREKDRIMWNRSEITSISSNQVAETESIGSSNDAFHSSDTFEKQMSSSSLAGPTSRSSFEIPKSMSNILENLQTQLKLRDGEIAQLRGEINMLERTRSSMAEEIVRLTNLNEDLEGVSEELQGLKGKLAEVESRYTAILTMYGEKEEQNEELRMDLEDVKTMYRQQIDSLLKPYPT